MTELDWAMGTRADAGAVEAFGRRAFDPEYHEYWTAPQIAAQLASPSSWLLLGRSGGQMVAFSLNRFVDHETVELLLFAVSPEERRLGIGRTLLERTVASARERQAVRMFLEVRSNNFAARRLYENTGFTLVAKRPGYYKSRSGQIVDGETRSLLIGSGSLQ